MTKKFKKISALLLALVYSMSIATTALADELPFDGLMMTYRGVEGTEEEFEPGSFYSKTDLFGDFKGLMPGDVRTETITIKNTYTGCDYLNLYMGALPHDEANNPISPKVLDELTADERRDTLSELQFMLDFLEKLDMTVTTKNKNGNVVTLYEGHPNSLEKGFEGDPVLLGLLPYGHSVELNVTLQFPIELGNEYANRIGEVDWVFLVEMMNDDDDDDDNDDKKPVEDEKDPSSDSEDEEEGEVLGAVDENPSEEEGEVLGAVDEEEEKVLGITDAPKTGDDNVILPYIGLFAFGLIGMILTVVKRRKREE